MSKLTKMQGTQPSSRYGRGFIINIAHLVTKFSQSPERAWPGAQDYFTEMILPPQYKGTEVEELVDLLRQRIVWHQAGGPTDKEMYPGVVSLLNRLLVAIDRSLGVDNPDIGQYHS
jgi:hypothetical protein